jgi:hypothetical protein
VTGCNILGSITNKLGAILIILIVLVFVDSVVKPIVVVAAPATNEYDAGAAVGAVQDIVAVVAVLEITLTAVGGAGAVVTEIAVDGGELAKSVDAVVAVPVYLYNCAVTVTL